MKRYSIIYHLSLFSLLLLLIQPVFACSKVMRWNDDAPFSFVSASEPEIIKGLSIDMTRAILKSLNCELTLVKMPWARALESLKAGDIDLISGAYNTAERQAYAHFSSVAEYSANVLFLRKGEEQQWNLKSLADIPPRQFKLGAQINVSYSREFDRLTQQESFAQNLYLNSSRQSLWKMLQLKRIDGVIADKNTGLIELKNLGLKEKIVPSSLIVSNAPSFFAFSKKTTSEGFVKEFDDAFLRLMQAGKISEIESSYLD